MAATNLIATSTTATTGGTSSTADASVVAQVAADFTVAVITPNTALNFYVERQGSDNQWYVVWESGPVTVAPSQPSMPPLLAGVPGTVRVRWTIVGNAGSPSATFTASVVGSGVGTGGSSNVVVSSALPTGANIIGQVKLVDSGGANVGAVTAAGALKVDPSAVTQPVNQVAATTGGSTRFSVRNLTSTVTAIKASAGILYSVQVINNQAAVAFVQIFNVAAGSVVLGTTTPDLEIQVAANASANLNLPSMGSGFATAISVASATAEGGGTGSAAGVQVFAQFA